jgi:hypothetical protein
LVFLNGLVRGNSLWPAQLALILFGLGFAFWKRQPYIFFGLLLSVIMLVFFGLWGRVVQRYYIFVYLFLLFLQAYAALCVSQLLARKVKRRIVFAALALLIVFGLRPPFVSYAFTTNIGKYASYDLFQPDEGQSIGQVLTRNVGDTKNTVLITSRFGESIAYLYTNVDAYRPQFIPDKLAEAVSYMLATGRRVYFLYDGRRVQEKAVLKQYREILDANFTLQQIDQIPFFMNAKGALGQLYSVTKE